MRKGTTPRTHRPWEWKRHRVGWVLQAGPGPQDTQGEGTWKRRRQGSWACTGFHGVGDPVRVGGNETNSRDSGFAAASPDTCQSGETASGDVQTRPLRGTLQVTPRGPHGGGGHTGGPGAVPAKARGRLPLLWDEGWHPPWGSGGSPPPAPGPWHTLRPSCHPSPTHMPPPFTAQLQVLLEPQGSRDPMKQPGEPRHPAPRAAS